MGGQSRTPKLSLLGGQIRTQKLSLAKAGEEEGGPSCDIVTTFAPFFILLLPSSEARCLCVSPTLGSVPGTGK